MAGTELNFLALILAVLHNMDTNAALEKFDLLPDPKIMHKERNAYILELYMAGYTYQQIGDRVGETNYCAQRVISRMRDAGMPIPRRSQGKISSKSKI